MAKAQIVNSRLQAGQWKADLLGHGSTAPDLVVVFGNQTQPPIDQTYEPARDIWHLHLPLPAGMVTDGIHTCLLQTTAGETLFQLTLSAGEVLADDLRAQIGLLRAELELLKSAFRKSQSH